MIKDLESRIPKKFGLDGTEITLKEKIGSLSEYSLSLFKGDFNRK